MFISVCISGLVTFALCQIVLCSVLLYFTGNMSDLSENVINLCVSLSIVNAVTPPPSECSQMLPAYALRINISSIKSYFAFIYILP